MRGKMHVGGTYLMDQGVLSFEVTVGQDRAVGGADNGIGIDRAYRKL